MVASGRAKRARKHVFQNQGAIEDLPPAQQRYIEKKITRLMNDVSGKNQPKGFDVRAFPCQEMAGKFAMLPADAEPEFNEDDGKWYLDGELIVSANFKARERRRNKSESTAVVNGDAVTDIAIVNMEPEALGE